MLSSWLRQSLPNKPAGRRHDRRADAARFRFIPTLEALEGRSLPAPVFAAVPAHQQDLSHFVAGALIQVDDTTGKETPLVQGAADAGGTDDFRSVAVGSGGRAYVVAALHQGAGLFKFDPAGNLLTPIDKDPDLLAHFSD